MEEEIRLPQNVIWEGHVNFCCQSEFLELLFYQLKLHLSNHSNILIICGVSSTKLKHYTQFTN